MKQYIIAILTCFILLACDRNNTISKYDADPRTNFDALWEILDERYCYFTYKGIDWTEVYNQFLPRVNKVKDVFQLFDLMAEMIDILEDGHVNLYAPFDVSSCTGWFDSYPADYNADFLYNHFDSDLRSAGGFAYTTIDNGKVGYIRYSSFSNGFTTANLAYIDAYFHQLHKVKGIVIDVRNNGGGSLSYSEKLAACFFKKRLPLAICNTKLAHAMIAFPTQHPS
jgi:hypothetical protein